MGSLKFFIASVLISVTVFLMACDNTTSNEPISDLAPTPSPGFTITIQDSEGNSVTFDEPPERIVVFDSAAVETLFAIGEGHRIVATHDFVSYPPEVANIPRVGDASSINIEAIVALKPDLIFIFYPRFNEQLRNAGLKVLYLQSLNVDFLKTTDNIRMWGAITGNRKAAEALSTKFEQRVAKLKELLAPHLSGPSVFYDTFQLWTPGPDTLIGNVLDMLKLENVASNLSGFEQMSPEAFVSSNPDVIFTFDPTFFTDNPAFSEIRAIKNDKIFPASELLSIAGPRFVEGIEEIAALVYPNLYP